MEDEAEGQVGGPEMQEDESVTGRSMAEKPAGGGKLGKKWPNVCRSQQRGVRRMWLCSEGHSCGEGGEGGQGDCVLNEVPVLSL